MRLPDLSLIDHPGARQIGLIGRCMEALAIHPLLPDQGLIVGRLFRIPAPVRVTRASDSSRAIVYSPGAN